jgi:imidazoleglycerol phosphate dehydratase HisB
MENLGWTINNLPQKTEIKRKTKETDIVLEFAFSSYNEVVMSIKGTGDLGHHLIEDVMIVLNKLSELQGVGHKITQDGVK